MPQSVAVASFAPNPMKSAPTAPVMPAARRRRRRNSAAIRAPATISTLRYAALVTSHTSASRLNDHHGAG